MRKQRIRFAVGCCLSILLGFSAIGQALAASAHSGLTWQGSQTCVTCHEAQAIEAHGSSHYQWQGDALYTVNGPSVQGKLKTAFNSYCISILGNWNSCSSCHVGIGAKPEATATPSQLNNIDCLICHQKDYKRKKVNGVFVPDTASMTITMDLAIQTVHKPVRSNCVQCHAKGGGGDNNKRGDMSLAHATTTDRNFDVHMSSTGANLTCQECHTTEKHRIAGRGSDLRQTDLDVKMSCSTATCHPTKSTASGHVTADVNRHVGRVACQTCHIKTYARNAADTAATETTEVYRDWTIPEWSTALNRWEPTITRGGNLTPEYAFWNGASWNYSLGEGAQYDTVTKTYPTSYPEGGINQSGSMLYPFKYKQALQPYADSLGVLVALDTSVYFSTGDYNRAVKAGLVNMGYPETTPYRNIETDTTQLITHEVMPKASAMTCAQCHTASATQMQLKPLGYGMKGTQATTCTQCHGTESMPSYTSLHKKHVTDKKYDCSWCHNFSRPERSLKMPSGVQTALLLSPISRTVSQDAGETVFTVSSTGGTMTWSAQVTSGSDWLTITSGTTGQNSGSIKASYSANTKPTKRLATIRVSASGAAGSPTDVVVTQSPSQMLSLAVSFADSGLWTYMAGSSSWQQVNTVLPVTMGASAMGLYASFSGNGLHHWNGTAWNKINTIVPDTMVVSGEVLYAAFKGYGLYSWNGTLWKKLNSAIPSKMVVSSGGLYATFDGYGLYYWNGTSWKKLNSAIPEKMVVSEGGLYATFKGYGLYQWNGTAWKQINTVIPTDMTVSGTSLYANFTGYGLYHWNGTIWSKRNAVIPENMVATSTALYADFGVTYGLWSWNGAAWTKISTNDSLSLVISDSILYADFGVHGLQKWNGSSWTELLKMNPLKMVGLE